MIERYSFLLIPPNFINKKCKKVAHFNWQKLLTHLSIYADSFNGKLYHYQNYNNQEIDAVIELDDGEWCAFEIKLGANKIDEAADNLIKISKNIVETGGKAPKVMCVICGTINAAYLRPDGVYVMPITSLKN